MVEPGEIRVTRMALISTNRVNARSGAVAIGEPRWVRVVLITVVLLFLGVFLFLPLIVVFTEALRKARHCIWSRSSNRMRLAPSN